MANFAFLTQTNSIAAQYFAKAIKEVGSHRFEIVPTVEDLIGLRPDFVMFTAYDQAEEYYLAREWIDKIKNNLPSAKIILGGPAFRSRPVAFFWNLKADYVLRGEADFTFPQLAREITKETFDPDELKKIPGVMFAQEGRLFINSEYPSLTRNQLEALDFSHYCMYESDMVSVFTERGCPYGCTFCSRVFGKRIRFLSVDRIMSILKEVSENPQIKRVMFANDNTVYNLRRAHKLFTRIIDEKLNQRFSFLINGRIDNFITDDKKYYPHRINSELIDLLQKAGVEKISVGTESFNDAEIKRLKPEARYNAIDAMRLTKALGEKGITLVHFIISPSPDALPEEAIESACRRFAVMDSYADYIEQSAVFANPVKISLVRGSGLYNRAFAKDFAVTDLNGKKEDIIDINDVENAEKKLINKTSQDVYLPFLTPVNPFGTSADPYKNLLILEEELKTLKSLENRSEEESKRLKKLSKKIRTCRKQVNRTNAVIKNINERTRQQLKAMLAEIGGVGNFLKEFSKLTFEKKREKLAGFAEKFNQASLLGPINVFEADAAQIFYFYVAQAVKELMEHSGKEKQVIRKHKKLTKNIVINKMIQLRENTPLRIYLNFLGKDIPTDRPSIEVLKKHLKKYESHPW